MVLVALTIFAASLAAGLDLTVSAQRWQFLILALAIILTLCVNLWMLQRRFRPLERLIERIEQIDPAAPSTLDFERGDPVALIAHQVVWGAILLAVGRVVLTRGSRRLVVQGG